jgi:hypothetical protein
LYFIRQSQKGHSIVLGSLFNQLWLISPVINLWTVGLTFPAVRLASNVNAGAAGDLATSVVVQINDVASLFMCKKPPHG